MREGPAEGVDRADSRARAVMDGEEGEEDDG